MVCICLPLHTILSSKTVCIAFINIHLNEMFGASKNSNIWAKHLLQIEPTKKRNIRLTCNSANTTQESFLFRQKIIKTFIVLLWLFFKGLWQSALDCLSYCRQDWCHWEVYHCFSCQDTKILVKNISEHQRSHRHLNARNCKPKQGL